MPPKRTLRTRASLIREPSPLPTRMSRPRRAASSRAVTIARDASSSPDETNKSLRLTVKMPSSKLREATSASQARASATSRDPVEDSNVVRGPRASRTKKSYVVESESDDDEEDEEEEDAEAEVEVEASDDEEPEDGERVDLVGGDEEEEEEEEEDAEEEEEEEGAGAVEDESAEEEEADEDEDEEMEDAPAPTPPTIKAKGPASKPSVTVTPAQDGKLRDVEAQEMLLASSEADEEDDEELSELESDGEGGAAGEEDAEGEDVDMEDDDDERSLEVGSRASTPDVSKMTKRQKSRLNEVMGSDFLALPMEPQIKKHLTAEEHAMRRAEMARRRKNLSEKRNEEEKMDTINRLLKKQAPKRRGKISAAEIAAQNAADENEENDAPVPEVEKANPLYVRWVSDASGCRVGVPGEWMGSPMGHVFGSTRIQEIG